MGHLHIRKIIKEETMYKDRTVSKHKCVFAKLEKVTIIGK